MNNKYRYGGKRKVKSNSLKVGLCAESKDCLIRFIRFIRVIRILGLLGLLGL